MSFWLTLNISHTLFYCFYCLLWTHYTLCATVSIVNFEHVIAGWVRNISWAPVSMSKTSGRMQINIFWIPLETYQLILLGTYDDRNLRLTLVKLLKLIRDVINWLTLVSWKWFLLFTLCNIHVIRVMASSIFYF